MEIEENVPIPPKQGKYSSLVCEMKEGDSVVCSSFTEAETVRHAIYTCEGYKPIVRIQLDDKDTYRVWKVKKEVSDE
jgi:hypothetical protein